MKNEIKLTFPPNGYAVSMCLFASLPAYCAYVFFFRSIKLKVPIAAFSFANWIVLAVMVGAFLSFIILPLAWAFPQKFYRINSEGIYKSLKCLFLKTAPNHIGWQDVQSLSIESKPPGPMFHSSTYYLCCQLKDGKKLELLAAKNEAMAKDLKARLTALRPAGDA